MEIRNEEVYCNGVPWSKWTLIHWNLWKKQTEEIGKLSERVQLLLIKYSEGMGYI